MRCARRPSRPTIALLLALALLPAGRAWGVKNWYDHYFDARDRHMPAGRLDQALESLQAAVRLKPQSALKEQTYGLEFVDYLPYYQMGLCYLRKGDFEAAERMFEREERAGAIRKSPLYADLSKRRADAQNGQSQRLAREVRDQAQRRLREADDAARRGRLDEALAKLAEAGTLAAQLNDPELQQALDDRSARLRAEQRRQQDDLARARRLEQALSEGQRLLAAGDAAAALVRFDEVLSLDAQNAAAAAGQREARALILASRTRAGREEALRDGKALFEAQKYEEALESLSVAAADPGLGEARDLLAKARQVLESMRRQKDLRGRVEALLAEGERLFAEGRYPQAQVRFEAVLALDAAHAGAQERLRRAEELSGLALMSRWLPNYPPFFTLLEPSAPETEVEGPSLTLVGVAYDDRGLASLRFESNGALLAALEPPPDEAPRRTWRFDRPFELRPGLNEITVVARDVLGVERRETYRVTRRLRFYETRAFAPSVALGAGALVATGLIVQRVRRRRAVHRRFNPYIAGAPVMDEALFFGRQRLLARILNVLHHNSLIITGERRIGKTTFLYHLKRRLEADEVPDYRFFPVSVDLQGVPEHSFFQALMADIVDALTLSPATQSALRFDGAARTTAPAAGPGDERADLETERRREPDVPPSPTASAAPEDDRTATENKWRREPDFTSGRAAGGLGGAAQPPPVQRTASGAGFTPAQRAGGLGGAAQPPPVQRTASGAGFTPAQRAGGLGGAAQPPPVQPYDARDFSHDAQLVIEELKGRTEKHAKLTLLIDEVDVLNEYSEQTNQRLRSIFMKTFSQHLVAVMSGVGIKRAWKSEGSPWYNFFDEIELQPFDREDAEALIRTPVADVFRYEPEAVEAILAGSDMKPYIIQKFCIHAVNRMLERGRSVVTLEDVEAVRETARFDRGGDEETRPTRDL